MTVKNYLNRLISALFVQGLWVSSVFSAEEAAAKPQTVFSSEINSAKRIINIIMEFCIEYGFQVLGGVIVLVIGIFCAKTVAKILAAFLQKKNIDVTVSKFIISIVKILIIAFAVLIALGKFGITIAPFIAGISVIGFGTSFALQGPLSNYASGATLVFTKPFKVGDIIEVIGVAGEVQDMTLPRTLLKTVDGNTVVIPNKHIIGEVIQNFSNHKRLDITVGVSYDSDIDKCLDVIRNVVKSDQRIVKTPEPKIGVREFADSSINIYARLWCRQADYWDVMFDTNRFIHKEFNTHNINIPFPQRDIHLFNSPGGVNDVKSQVVGKEN